MLLKDYNKALKMGKADSKNAIAEGSFPYLTALDSFLPSQQIKTEENLGIVSIPLDQIVGTKTVGRQQAFAPNFMPIMPADSEFAWKWQGVVEYHLETGIADPIIAYEYMNRFYVLEGNKRVSVLKYFKADAIEGSVIRLIPYKQDNLQNDIYYEFLDFYKDTQINYLWFSEKGSFPKLIAAVGKTPGEKWSDDDKMNFRSFYHMFSSIFEEKGGNHLGITAADAMLFYLSLYPYQDVLQQTPAEMQKDINKIWHNIPQLGDEEIINDSVVYTPTEETDKGLFAKFFSSNKIRQLKIAFIHDFPEDQSSWTYMHELGRLSLDREFEGSIITEAYSVRDSGKTIAKVIEEAIEAGNHMIFTTSSLFLSASLKASIEHPEVKILNCSIGRPYKTLRTYYGRLYEAKFLTGMIAGVMTKNDKIAYKAPMPNYGTVADINAFTLGARMTNPRAKVYLHWNSQANAEPFKALLEREEISVVSDNNFITPSSENRDYGLYTIEGAFTKHLATPINNWVRFYDRIVRDYLAGNWDSKREAKEKPAINYWWGISSGIVDLITSKSLPWGIQMLTDIIKEQMQSEYFKPFWGKFRKQDGTFAGVADQGLSAEEIIMMDYLVDGVVGSIPDPEELTHEAKNFVEREGQITPEASKI